MGDYRIVIDAVGGHGQDRDKKDGEVVDFAKDSLNSPEAQAVAFVKQLQSSGNSVVKAKVIHWPSDNYGGPSQNNRDPEKEIVDDLITGVRKGNF